MGVRSGRSSATMVVAMCFVAGSIAAMACGGSRSDASSGDSTVANAGGAPATPIGGGEARCYRSAASVLLGPSRGGTSEGRAPGWIRLERVGTDSGMAHLTDAGGAGLMASWQRVDGDSVHFAGFDDFLRVEMRLALTDANASGRAVATSDAAAERDSAGHPGDLRREWQVDAARASCDSMPARPQG